MKKQIYIITILFLVLNISFISAQTQEEELKNNMWYVHKVILDDTEYIAPLNEERLNFFYNYNFNFNQDYEYFELFFCSSYYGNNVMFLENQQFSVEGWISLAIIPSSCSIQENSDYDFLYSSVMNPLVTAAPLIYSYEVNTIDGSTKQLIITNQNGDKAYFYNYYLSNPLFELSDISIYPNPVSDVVQIAMPNTAKERYDYKIYDSNGKLIKVFKDKKGLHITLEIQDLASGIYWLEINTPDAQQRGYSTKIIKK